MGSGASSTLHNELEKPLDASDVQTPRGVSALNEVQRLRTLLLAQEAEHQRAGAVLDPDIIVEQRHTDAVNYEKAIIELFEAADEDRDGELKLEEFRAVMQRADLGLSDGDIIALVEQLDIDGNHIITWREFLPLALTLVDSMEAQTAAAKARLDKVAWAEHEAAALEAMYAPDFENAIEGAVAHLEFFEGSGGGMSRKEDVKAVLSELRAPDDLRQKSTTDSTAGDGTDNPSMGDNNSVAMETHSVAAATTASELIEANPLLRTDEITKLCNLLDRGIDGSRKEIMDTVLLKATALDVRFQTVKNDLLEMTNSALCEHMLAQAIKLSAMEEGTGDGHGVPGWYALTRPRLQKFLANNPAVPLEPLQVLSILKLAKPTPLPDPAPSADEVAGLAVAAPPKGPARFVDVTEFIPLAAATIENMFDPKYLVRRSALLKRGCLRPVELIHAKHPDRDALEAKLASLFDKYDRDGDGALNEKEFNNLISKLDLGLEPRDIAGLRSSADTDRDGVVNPHEFMTFAFATLLHLLREQALQHHEEGFGHDLTADAMPEIDLAGNPDTLLLQGRTRTVVTQKLVTDMKATYDRKAAAQLLKDSTSRRTRALMPQGIANLNAAARVFTKHATTFNATKKEQLARDLNEDLPFAPTLFPSMDEEEKMDDQSQISDASSVEKSSKVKISQKVAQGKKKGR